MANQETEDAPATQPRARRTRTPQAAGTEAVKPKRTRKAKAEPEPVAAGPETNPAEVEARPKRTRKKAVEAAPVDEPKPKTRRTRKKAAEPEPVELAEAPPAETAKPEETTRRRTRKPKAGPDPATPEEPAAQAAQTVEDDEMAELPVPVWRPVTNRPPVAETEPDEEEEAQAPVETLAAEERTSRLAPRRSRGRRRKDRRDLVITAEAALRPPPAPAPKRARTPEPKPVQPVVEKPQPEVPRRAPIPVPEDAARVLLKDGVPMIVRNRTIYPPIAFFASAEDAEHLATVLDEVKMASENGIHLFSIMTELMVDPGAVNEAVSFAGHILKRLTAVDPDCQVLFRVVFVAPSGWEKKYPRGRYLSEDGGLADPSVTDEEFWSVAESCLESFITKLRRLDVGDHVMGVHLERGEWFFSAASGYDTSVAAQNHFRDWLGHRYRFDAVSLRAAWFDGQVQFDTVAVPEERGIKRQGDAFVRTDRKARRWVDYHLYLSDATCERIASLAYAAKRASEGRYLVGVSYGYTFEWSHPHSGHLSLGKLLRCPEIDYVAGPPSYRNREPGGSAAVPGPIDSVALNGKIAISEEDFKTPISGRREPDDFNPVMKTPQALESVHWRGIGAALAHGSGVCWMDTWGNGWLASHGIWQRAARATRALVWRLATPQQAPEVAVFVDERSLAYLIDERAFTALVQNVRESVLRSGLSVGFYLLSDLAHRESFPDSKLYVFMNAWDIRPEVRSAIKTRLQRDGKVLVWLYSAGLFEGGRESLERVREVTGIALRPQPFNSKAGTTILASRDPLCTSLPERAIAAGGQLEPSYFAIPEDGRVLGEYTATGLPSYVVRRFTGEAGDWTSVFLGEPVVSAGLFRALGQLAGAHVWSFTDDLVHVRPPFLTVHCSGAGQRTLALPEKWVAFSLTSGAWQTMESNSLRFQTLDGQTHVFIVGLRADVEHMLAMDPDDVLELHDAPIPEDNTVHWEAMSFDVPIMKLDEWVEESWGDDLADDLLLKPSMIEAVDIEPVSDEEDEPSQRSRGRRRRRRRRGGSEESAHPRREGADRQSENSVLNVVFRKRE